MDSRVFKDIVNRKWMKENCPACTQLYLKMQSSEEKQANKIFVAWTFTIFEKQSAGNEVKKTLLRELGYI